MTQIRAVLFDCDGLMFDTESRSQEIFREEARNYGVILPDDFFVRITGGTSEEDRRYIRSIPGIDAVMNASRKRRFDLSWWASMAADSLSKPGLKELFAWLEEKGIPRAICSSSRREYVETLISTVSGGLKYDEIVCGDMVSRPKPDPEIFLKAAAGLGVAPENCMVLEDSRQGITAARRAGMHSCFIRDTIEPDEEMRTMIEYERNDLQEVIQLLAGMI